MLVPQQSQAEQRRGLVLLVVVAMLTLFAITGIAFVYYAMAQADLARVAREGESQFKPEVTADDLLALFLGQMIYDVNDGSNSVYSALRGHSFARTMYGDAPLVQIITINGGPTGGSFTLTYAGQTTSNIAFNAAASTVQTALQALSNIGAGNVNVTGPNGGPYTAAFTGVSVHPRMTANAAGLTGGINSSVSVNLSPVAVPDKPFTGTGRLHNTFSFGFPAVTVDDFQLINYTYFAGDGFLRDPDHLGTRTGLSAGQGSFAGQLNVPYTYPDLHNMALAMIRASDGKVLMPSFHRSWLFNPSNVLSDPTNTNWTNPQGKYYYLGPRPKEHPGFPYPDDAGGYVKNLPSAPGGNDSIWIDIGAPVMVAPDGRKYKALFAPLVIDLDGRINWNVVGNILGTGNTHASSQGWGPWEVNPYKLAGSSTMLATELQKIFLGSTTTGAARVYGRYGSSRLPQGIGLAPGTGSRGWFNVDFNGIYDPASTSGTPGNATTRFLLPGEPSTTSYFIFPAFNDGYSNGVYAETTTSGLVSGTPNHPSIFNALQPVSGNRLFNPFHMAALLRWGGNGSDAQTTDLLKVCPNAFGIPMVPPFAAGDLAQAAKIRNLSTVLSNDLDRPGAAAYVWDPNDSTTKYTYNTSIVAGPYPSSPLYPSGVSIPFPAITTLQGTPPAGSEFDATTKRSKIQQALALLTPYVQSGKLDLSRKLTDYPMSDPGAPWATADITAAGNAIIDRQNFARDIYYVLCLATGCRRPDDSSLPMPITATTSTTVSADYEAARWLAQLAVNIVDYIDQDDYSTAFLWDTNPANNPPNTTLPAYVFGTELPRLNVNEVYLEIDNDPNDPGTVFNALTNPTPKATTRYNISAWVELHNPFFIEPTSNGGGNGYGRNDTQALLQIGTTPVYQIILAKNTNGTAGDNLTSILRHPANTTGDPEFLNGGTSRIFTNFYNASAPCIMNSWTPAMMGTAMAVAPLNGDYHDPAKQNTGFWVVAPAQTTSVFTGGTDPTNLPVTSRDTHMTFTIDVPNLMYQTNDTGMVSPLPTILLQRLACPGLSPNYVGMPATLGTYDPTKPYNPYITIDYVETNMNNSNTIKYVNEGRNYDRAGPVPMYNAMTMMGRNTLSARVAYGRNQPYAAAVSQLKAMNPPAIAGPVPPAQPLNTFYRHNAVEPDGTPPSASTMSQTLTLPFNWLAFMDRQLVSPMELFHVSAYKPHELTQVFVNNSGVPNGQMTAAWLDQDSRLYRFLEFVQTKSRYRSVALGGRVPGRTNVNTAYDNEIWRAICDAQKGNGFYYDTSAGLSSTPASPSDKNVDTIFANPANGGWANGFVPDRSGTSDGATGQMPGANDRPVWPFSLGHASNTGDPISPVGVYTMGTEPNRGLRNTILRSTAGSDATTPIMMDPFPGMTTVHPYHHNELINKIFNNLTTRSNSFAVWVTVGYFEVTNDQTRPVTLGAEMNKADNRNIRHRMFAIIDRTNLTAFSTATTSSVPASTAISLLSNNSTLPQATINVVSANNYPTSGQMLIQTTAGFEPISYTGTTATSFTGCTGGSGVMYTGGMVAQDLAVPASGTNPNTNRNWSLAAGLVLTIDPENFDPTTGNNLEETIVVRTDTMGNLRVIGTNAHANGAKVICRGNPGPWQRYDPRNDSTVVPYWTIID